MDESGRIMLAGDFLGRGAPGAVREPQHCE
jgi:hypothetical protein